MSLTKSQTFSGGRFTTVLYSTSGMLRPFLPRGVTPREVPERHGRSNGRAGTRVARASRRSDHIARRIESIDGLAPHAQHLRIDRDLRAPLGADGARVHLERVVRRL